MTTVAEKWADVLGRSGVRYVFGIPSGPWVEYMEALRISDLEFVLVSNEASAGFMADVCGRITGIPGACYGTFGPGATNLSTGVGGALLDRSPLLAFTHTRTQIGGPGAKRTGARDPRDASRYVRHETRTGLVANRRKFQVAGAACLHVLHPRAAGDAKHIANASSASASAHFSATVSASSPASLARPANRFIVTIVLSRDPRRPREGNRTGPNVNGGHAG